MDRQTEGHPIGREGMDRKKLFSLWLWLTVLLLTEETAPEEVQRLHADVLAQLEAVDLMALRSLVWNLLPREEGG